MKRTVALSFIISGLLICLSCVKKPQGKSVDTLDIDTLNIIPEIDTLKESVLNPDSLLLYVIGDWDGDGMNEKLTERYFSKKLNKEVISPYFMDTIDDFMDKVSEAIKLDARVYLVSEKNKIDTLIISDVECRQTWGVGFFLNMGDMDGDGGEELGYVERMAQMSSLTMYHIASYKNKKWIELFSFPTWSWSVSDSLVIKTGDFQYEVRYRGRESFEEKMILDFKKNPRPESLPYFVEGTMDEDE